MFTCEDHKHNNQYCLPQHICCGSKMNIITGTGPAAVFVCPLKVLCRKINRLHQPHLLLILQQEYQKNHNVTRLEAGRHHLLKNRHCQDSQFFAVFFDPPALFLLPRPLLVPQDVKRTALSTLQFIPTAF